MINSFDAADFNPYLKEGTGTVVGQAFLKTRGGDVKFGAGNVVELMPMTPYIRERFDRALLHGENLGPRDSRVGAYAKTTIADGSGNFEFTNVPPGEYALYCSIKWVVQVGLAGMETGGWAYASVNVENGKTHRVILTQ